MERSPIEALWAAVKAQTGPARGWHINDLYNHERRYLADLRLIEALAPAGTILEIGLAPPFADGAFHCVMLCETFEHLRIDPAFVLSEINRVQAPGATLVLTTPNVYSLPSLGRFLLGRSIADPLAEFGKLRNVGHMGHVREYSAREIVILARKARGGPRLAPLAPVAN